MCISVISHSFYLGLYRIFGTDCWLFRILINEKTKYE